MDEVSALKVLVFRKILHPVGLAAPVWPAGVRLRPVDLALDGPEARQLLNVAYARGGGEILDAQLWIERLRQDAEFDPALCLAARETASGRLAGFAQCWTSAFVKDIAVAQDWRGKGVGRALMAEIFALFHARGATAVALKVEADNPSGAVRFYQSLGMETV